MPKTNIKLGGQFKLDVFDVSGNHLRSSDYIDNFITNTGVLYPYYFAFADCFRYLSMGIGTTANSTGTNGSGGTLNIPPTTGLHSPVSQYTYLGSGNYVTGGFLGGGCGNFANPHSNTISLIRQWGIPDTTGGSFQAAFNFSEFMVSPGRPYVTGFTDGTNTVTTGLCTCLDLGYSEGNNTSTPDLTGLDCSQIAIYHSLLPRLGELTNNQDGSVGGARPRLSLCDAPLAFARVLNNFPVASGEILTITYKLNLTFGTGINFNSFLSSNYNPADNNWLTINSFSNITNPGIKLIVDGYLKQINPTIYGTYGRRLQQFNYVNATSPSLRSLYGESFIPSVGIALEPSAVYGQNGNFSAYVSDDNTQFLVSSSGGVCHTGNYKPWNTTGLNLPQNSGLLPFSILVSGNMVTGAIFNGSDGQYWFRNPYNIRQGNGNSSVDYPSGADVSTPNNLINPNIFSGSYSNSLLLTGARFAAIKTKYQFDTSTYLNLGQSIYVRSVVIGYIDAGVIPQTFTSVSQFDHANVVPFYDCLFSGTSYSDYFIPTIGTGGQTNTPPTTFTGYNDTNYNYLTGIAGTLFPIFTYQLTWTADCPAGVDGC